MATYQLRTSQYVIHVSGGLEKTLGNQWFKDAVEAFTTELSTAEFANVRQPKNPEHNCWQIETSQGIVSLVPIIDNSGQKAVWFGMVGSRRTIKDGQHRVGSWRQYK
jgi:hypothetical protein